MMQKKKDAKEKRRKRKKKQKNKDAKRKQTQKKKDAKRKKGGPDDGFFMKVSMRPRQGS